jgi:nucleoside-diphosphate-sugar epimerase
MKLLITGATGFIGQNLIKNLMSHNINIHIVVRQNSDISNFSENISVFKYDEKIDSLIYYFENEKFDGVIHLASLFLATHNNSDISNLINSNIKFGTELLEASVKSNVKWFLNTGTFWQNYENEDYNPVNLYAATKEAFENIAKFYTQTSNLIFTTIKLNDTFGANDTRNKVFNLWYKIFKNDEVLGMSAGNQIIDISYIDDVTNAYSTMIDNLNKDDKSIYNHKTFVVTNNQKPTLKELSKIFEDVIDNKLKINWGDREYRHREVMQPFSQGITVPNWKQQYSLKDAITITLKDMNHG